MLDRMKISNANVSSPLSGISFTPCHKLIVTDGIIREQRICCHGYGCGHQTFQPTCSESQRIRQQRLRYSLYRSQRHRACRWLHHYRQRHRSKGTERRCAAVNWKQYVASERDKPIVHRGSAVELIQGRVKQRDRTEGGLSHFRFPTILFSYYCNPTGPENAPSVRWPRRAARAAREAQDGAETAPSPNCRC